MLFKKKNKQDDSFWISAADLMSGVMIIFLLISFMFIFGYKIMQIKNAEAMKELDIYKKMKNEYEKNRQQLKMEFKKIGLELDENLTFIFDSKSVFKAGEAKLDSDMEKDLKLFFDKIIPVAYTMKHLIKEIRIEGYASSEWYEKGKKNLTKSYKYLKNMSLSQARTFSVTNYILKQYENTEYESWLLKTISSSGFSSSNFIYKKNDQGIFILDNNGNKIEDREKSRRVGFSLVQAGEDNLKFK